MKNIITIFIFIFLFGCDRSNQSSQEQKNDDKERSKQSPAPEIEGEAPSDSATQSRLRSAQMESALAEPTPEWLTLGSPIEAARIEDASQPATAETPGLRPMGTVKNIEFQGKNIHFPFPLNEIMWLSISPRGDRVAFRRGNFFEIRELREDGSLGEEILPLPYLNYQAPNDRRWFFSRWYWLSEDELIADLHRQDQKGDMIAEIGLYHYNISSQTLSEVVFPEKLIDSSDPYLEVLGIAERQVQVRTLKEKAWLMVPDSP